MKFPTPHFPGGGRAHSNAAACPVQTRNPLKKRGLRRAADHILRCGARVRPESALLVWRAAELTSDRERRACARSLHATVKELEGRSLPGSVPLNRRGARPYTAAIAAVAEQVGDLSMLVTPRSMVLVRDLLSDGDGPLYARANIDQLPAALTEIQSELHQTRSAQSGTGSTLREAA